MAARKSSRTMRKPRSAAQRRRARPSPELPPDCGPNSPTYEARLKAAFGRDGDAPANIDVMRERLARRIAIFLNEWRGCPEPICRRHRGCMAPRIACTNVPPVEATPEQTARTLALVNRVLREVGERRAAEDE